MVDPFGLTIALLGCVAAAVLAGIGSAIGIRLVATVASGVLAEQLDPLTGAPVSVSPLTWSHSTFIAAALHYNSKLLGFSSAVQDAK